VVAFQQAWLPLAIEEVVRALKTLGKAVNVIFEVKSMSHQAFLREPNLHLLYADRLLIFFLSFKFRCLWIFFSCYAVHLLKVSFSGRHLFAVLGI
jgi:hypothetical protein